MRQQQSAADSPMRRGPRFFQCVPRTPWPGQALPFEPAGGQHPEAPRHLAQARSRELIVGSDESIRFGKAGFHQRSCALFEPPSHFGRGWMIEFPPLMMKTVLDDVVSGLA